MKRLVCYRLEPSAGPRTFEVPEGTEFVSATHFNGAPGAFAIVPEGEAKETAPVRRAPLLLAEIGKPFEPPVPSRAHLLGISVEPSGTAFAVYFLEIRGEAVGTKVVRPIWAEGGER